jgi:hypothetical protein
MRRCVSFSLSLVLAAAPLFAGCKQDLRERCEVNGDCASGLVCNQASDFSRTCVPASEANAAGRGTVDSGTSTTVRTDASPDVARPAADGAVDRSADTGTAAPGDAAVPQG